jgi:O-antigen biosynthesis protein
MAAMHAKSDRNKPPLISVILVSYNVREFLEQALLSILSALRKIPHEIYVVDNASSDGSVDYIAAQFPSVRLIVNEKNIGFARANNQAIRVAGGRYLCLVNPDTLIQEDTFAVLLDFMQKRSDVGGIGCKVLNPDGTLQLACRRSYPTPWVSFTKISGLARLFPRSRWFGRYNLTFLDPDKISEVEAISGSFMMVRSQVVRQVGLLDESFFMYGEDLDWCYRIRSAGWKIFYHPGTQIIHFKGESSKKSPFEQRRLFYEAMRLFVKKHFSKRGALIPSWLLILAIYARALVAFVSTAGRHLIWPFLDFLCMTFSLALAIFIRFHPHFPWMPFIPVHIVYSLVFIVSLASHGIYNRARFSGSRSIAAVLLGLLVNISITFFFKQYAFSRAVVLYAGFINLLLIPGWRYTVNTLALFNIAFFKKTVGISLLRRRSLIVGDAKSAAKIIDRLRSHTQETYLIHGVVLVRTHASEKMIDGVPILGPLDHLKEIVKREKIQEVIFTTDRLPYDKILSTIAGSTGSQVGFKLVPSHMDVIIGKASIDYLDDIPFVNLEYRLHTVINRIIKRSVDILLASFLLVFFCPVYLWHRYILHVPLQNVEMQGYEGKKIFIEYFHSNSHFKRWWHHLPRLKAVVRGDLAFVGREVGPRIRYNPGNISLLIKPGLTGLEHINRYLGLNKEDRKKYHLYYLKNYSLLLDAEIVLRTVMNLPRFKNKNLTIVEE